MFALADSGQSAKINLIPAKYTGYTIHGFTCTMYKYLYLMLLTDHFNSNHSIFIFMHMPCTQVVRISGNLKVMPPPAKTGDTADEQVEFVEPSVVGFVGECHVIESVPSILQISFSHSTFVMLKNDKHQMTYIEAS